MQNLPDLHVTGSLHTCMQEQLTGLVCCHNGGDGQFNGVLGREGKALNLGNCLPAGLPLLRLCILLHIQTGDIETVRARRKEGGGARAQVGGDSMLRRRTYGGGFED